MMLWLWLCIRCTVGVVNQDRYCMKFIGAHVGVKGGVSSAPREAKQIGARAFALFTGSSARWSSKPISDEEALKFRTLCNEYGYDPSVILPHDNFLINLGSPDETKLSMSRKSFLDEMQRCGQLGLRMLNFHPGSHLKAISEKECLSRIAESLNIVLDQTEGICAVLENTAGQGSNLGYSFQQLAEIIDGVKDKNRVGVCIDTCHAYSAGYDLATQEGYEKTWAEFDSLLGKEMLRAVHLNDDKKALGSRVDRHESIGKGTIGFEFFRRFINDPRFDNMPIILETPDESIWAEEIRLLYSLEGASEL